MDRMEPQKRGRTTEAGEIGGIPRSTPCLGIHPPGNLKRVEQDGENGKDERINGWISSIIPILPILLPTS
jgi:hypothetical protein